MHGRHVGETYNSGLHMHKKKGYLLQVTLGMKVRFVLLFCELESDRLTAIRFYVSTVLYGRFPFGSTAYRISSDICKFGAWTEAVGNASFIAG